MRFEIFFLDLLALEEVLLWLNFCIHSFSTEGGLLIQSSGGGVRLFSVVLLFTL